MSDLYVCMHKHARLGGSGACSPRKFFFKIGCSDIASEAIFGQKPSRSSCSGSWSIASNFWLSMCAFAKTPDFGFPREKVLSLRLAEQHAGGATSLEGQLWSA